MSSRIAAIGVTPPQDAGLLLNRFPDACRPIHVPVRNDSRRSLHDRQRLRRAEILSAARRQISEGHWQINVAALADSCSMAVQTVYNLAGDRHDILAAAVDEYYAALIGSALCSCNRSDAMQAIGEALWGGACINPDYMKNLTQAFFKQSDVVKQAIDDRIRSSFRKVLWQTPECALHIREDIHRASDRLHVLLALSAYEWMNERITLDELRQRVAEDIRIIVEGSLRQ